MFKGDSMYSILPIDATYFFNITKYDIQYALSHPQGQLQDAKLRIL